MLTKNSSRKLGMRSMLLAYVFSFALAALTPLIQPAVAAAAASDPQWVYSRQSQCTSKDYKETVDAFIMYKGKRFICDSYFTVDGQNIINLTNKDSCTQQLSLTGIYGEVIMLPNGGGNDWHTATSVRYWNPCNDTKADLTIQNKQTYNQVVAANAPKNVGDGVWTGSDLTSISAEYKIGDSPITAQATFTKGQGSDNQIWYLFSSHTVSCTDANGGQLHEFLAVGDSLTSYANAKTALLTVYDQANGCKQMQGIISLSKTYAVAKSEANDPSADANNCPIDGSTNIGWLLCPLFFLGRDAVKQLNVQIQNALYINTDQIFGNADHPSSFQRSYNVFRNVGLTLLVMAGLVMVISQAAGLEIFAAYTIKKTLPRIVIAAIGMSLAWPLLQFVITFFNDLGTWITDIVLLSAQTTAGSTPESLSTIGNLAVDAGFFTVAGGILLVIFGIWGGLSFLLSFALMLLIAYIVIVIRQVVILVCILLAPLAIAASVLPGTKKLWDFWEDTLVGALLMFPLIMGFLASGAALSFILGQAAANASTIGGQGGSSQQALVLMSVFVYFLPYLAIPFAFQMASGLMGRIFGMVNDRGKGWFGRLSKYREGQAAKNTHAFMAGSRYDPDHWSSGVRIGNRRYGFGSAVNWLGGHAGAGAKGQLGFGKTGEIMRSNNAILSADAAAKEDHSFAAQLNNEDAMAAVAYGNNAQALSRLAWFQDENGNVKQDKLRAAIAAGRTIKITQQTKTAAFDALVRSGKVLKNREEYNQALDQVAGGNASMRAAIKGNSQFTYRQVGRADLGRDTDYDSLKEMSMAEVGKQKAASLDNLFAGTSGIDANGQPTGNAPIVQAILDSRSKGNQAEQQHFADVLFAAQYNPYTTPEQQQRIAAAIGAVGQIDPNLLVQAQNNYSSKMGGGRGYGGAAGGAGAGGLAPGAPPPPAP